MSPLTRLQKELEKHQLEAILVSDLTNVHWLTGFTGTFGFVLVTTDKAFFLTDSRYAIQSREEVKNFEVAHFSKPITTLEFLDQYIKKLSIQKLAFEQSASYEDWQSWTKQFAPIQLVPAPPILDDLRSIKTPEEIKKIKKSCALADACMSHIQKMIRPGVKEYDLTLEVEFFFRRHSAGIGFPPIIVSGKNSAYPHGKPSEKRLDAGDFVTLDFGAILEGYHSDITRTYVVSEVSEKHLQIYHVVLEAQQAAMDFLKPGVLAKDVDQKARDVIAGYGFGEYFGHGLGHSLGMLCHDGQVLNTESTTMIRPNQVWTIEPGIYIEGFGGVRIEDDVVVTETGIELLTHSSRELMVLP